MDDKPNYIVTINGCRVSVEDPDTWGNWSKSKRFWGGIVLGALLMCVMDLTDMHFCIGECDNAGYDIIGPRK